MYVGRTLLCWVEIAGVANADISTVFVPATPWSYTPLSTPIILDLNLSVAFLVNPLAPPFASLKKFTSPGMFLGEILLYEYF